MITFTTNNTFKIFRNTLNKFIILIFRLAKSISSTVSSIKSLIALQGKNPGITSYVISLTRTIPANIKSDYNKTLFSTLIFELRNKG